MNATRRSLAALTCASAALLVGGAVLSATSSSPKAYVLGEIDVKDAQGYQAYVAAATPIVTKFGGVYLARGGRTVPLEGATPAGRVVVVEFPSLAAAQKFEASPEYLEVAAIRHRTATSRFFIVEGTAAPR